MAHPASRPAGPGPADRDKRIAPFAGVLDRPVAQPVAKALHVPPRLVALLALIIVAVGLVVLARLPQLTA